VNRLLNHAPGRCLALIALSAILIPVAVPAAPPGPGPGKGPGHHPRVPGPDVVIEQADCTAAKLGTDIPTDLIGEPVSAVTLSAPVWVQAAGQNPAYCRVNGSMAPIDPEAPNINFAVALPSVWKHRAVQVGGAA
jgi:feruloyl esterase